MNYNPSENRLIEVFWSFWISTITKTVNVKEYIESGILEQYALGLLTEKEASEVRRNAEKYPEIKQQIEGFEDALMQYAQANAMPLRPGLTQQILSALDRVIAPGGGGIQFFNWWTLLLTTLLLAAISSSLFFYQNNNQLQQQVNNTKAAYTRLERACERTETECKASNQQLNDKLNILRAMGNQTTPMKSLDENQQQIVAFVHRDTDTKAAYLDVADLQAPPSGKQYQLWYIAEAAPQSMGVFDLKEEFISIEFVEEAAVFAISLEEEGGSLTPTDIRFLGEV